MKKIKMLIGGYGLAEKSGRIALKTADDDPFNVSDTEAKRLVEAGRAEYVGKAPKKEEPKVEIPEEVPTEEPETEETEEQESEEAAVVDEMDIAFICEWDPVCEQGQYILVEEAYDEAACEKYIVDVVLDNIYAEVAPGADIG